VGGWRAAWKGGKTDAVWPAEGPGTGAGRWAVAAGLDWWAAAALSGMS